MILVKKYGNRRLYDTESSKYVNLDELAALIRAGHEIKVVDVGNGDDLTREVLLQILMETMHGADLLPTGLLRRIIRSTGDGPAERLLRTQISSGLEVLSTQMDQLETLFRTAPPPPEPPKAKAERGSKPPESEESAPEADRELDELRARLASLEKRLAPKRKK